eukprot:COSAG06_NODE_6311_length_2989_cov_8.844983_4_plen_308_part_00
MLARLAQHLRPLEHSQLLSSAASTSHIEVSAAHDCGNIEVVDVSSAPDLQLRIRPDVACAREEGKEHFHWFYFAARGLSGQRCTFRILNAGEASYAWKGWPSLEPGDPGFRARVSYDQREWRQCLETQYDSDSGVLTIELTPTADEVWIAAFEPYTAADHAAFLAEITGSGGGGSETRGSELSPALALAAEHEVLGESLDGAPIDLLTLPGGPLKIWVLGRQHPGESMGSFFIEGLLRRLASNDTTSPGSSSSDAARATVLNAATILAVPHTNPDGGSRGHLRTNAAGANLNREWYERLLRQYTSLA